MTQTERDKAIQDASRAHTSLVLFSKAADLATDSDVSSEYYSWSQKIARIARDAQARCLRDYDRAVARANK